MRDTLRQSSWRRPQTLMRTFRLLMRNPVLIRLKLFRILGPRIKKRAYRQRWNLRLSRYFLDQTKHVMGIKSTWMGVPIFKMPSDAWIYQELICRIRPEVIIEVGSDAGGSTLYFAHLLDLLGQGKVISIDVDRTPFKVRHDRIIILTGESTSPEILQRVRDQCRGKSVLISLDGNHRKEQVLRELEAYAPLVSLGSYIVVEDGTIDLYGPPDDIGLAGGPMAAVDAFLRTNSEFVVDTECERYIVTSCPKGFLKRVRLS